MPDTNFVTQTIQTLYNTSTAGSGFRTGGTDADDAAVRALDARIAAFEQVIFDDNLPAGVTNEAFPYDPTGLKREFLDEVLAMLLARNSGGTYARSVTITVYNYSDNSVHTGATTTTMFDAGLLRNNDFIFDAPSHDQYFTYQYNGESAVRVEGVAAPTFLLKGVTSFDDLTTAQKRDLLNPSGKAVFDYYSSLIQGVFDAGEELKTVRDAHTGTALDGNSAPVVTAIEPVTFSYVDGAGTHTVTYTHITTFRRAKVPPPTDPNAEKFDYIPHLVEEGLETYSLRKVPILNTASQSVGFQLGFDDATTKSVRYLPVQIVNGQYVPTGSGVPQSLALRNMYIDDYLYFWNEARTRILRAKLAYKEAVTKEMQEDLRQANEVLAELERLAAGAKPPGGNVGADTVNESLLLDLWEAKVGKTGEVIFNREGANGTFDDIQSYATWQENRTNLKNYIDRKSAQSQQAMLDYQTILNRYNNAFEVMSKIQEKIDSLLKSQLRNYN